MLIKLKGWKKLTNNTNIKDSKFLKINYKNKLSAKQICEELYKSDVQSVIVEGGTKTRVIKKRTVKKREVKKRK